MYVGEVVVEPFQGVERLVLVAGAELARVGALQTETLAEPLVVGFGHAQEVGHDEHGERLRVRADELAAAAADELVELLIGEAPHELLVLARGVSA